MFEVSPFISFPVMMIAGAFLWRLRGGLLNDLTGQENYKILGIPFNDTVVRILWSVGMTFLFCLFHPNFYHQFYWWGNFICDCQVNAPHLFTIISFVFVSLSLFYGTTVIGWNGAKILPTNWKQMGRLSLSGVLRMLLPALVMFSIWPLIAGLLFGPAYLIGAKIPVKYKWEFWGEIINGGMIGFIFNLV